MRFFIRKYVEADSMTDAIKKEGKVDIDLIEVMDEDEEVSLNIGYVRE